MTHESLHNGKGAPIGPQEGTLLGSLFESLVTLCVRGPAQTAEAEVRHLRTRNGDHEIDLIIVRPDGGILALDVKLSATFIDSDVQLIHWLYVQIRDRVMDSARMSTG